MLILLLLAYLPMVLYGDVSMKALPYRKVISRTSLKPICGYKITSNTNVKVKSLLNCASLCLSNTPCVSFNIRYDVTGDVILRHQCQMFDKKPDCYSIDENKCQNYQV